MVVTWLTTFTMLPAAAQRARAPRWIRSRSRRATRRAARARPAPSSRLGSVLVFGGADHRRRARDRRRVTSQRDPFTHDWRDLQSSTPAINARGPARRDGSRCVDSSGRSTRGSGLPARDRRRAAATRSRRSSRACARRCQAPAREALDPRRASASRTCCRSSRPRSSSCSARSATLIDDPHLQASLSDADEGAAREGAAAGRLAPVARRRRAAWSSRGRSSRRDGTRGRLSIVRGASRFNSFNVDDRLEFAARGPRARAAARRARRRRVAGRRRHHRVDGARRAADDRVRAARLDPRGVRSCVGLRRHGIVDARVRVCRRRRDDRRVCASPASGPLPRPDRAADHDRHRHRLRGEPRGARSRRTATAASRTCLRRPAAPCCCARSRRPSATAR